MADGRLRVSILTGVPAMGRSGETTSLSKNRPMTEVYHAGATASMAGTTAGHDGKMAAFKAPE